MDLFDENIKTEYIADITDECIEQKRDIEGYNYNMFQSTIIKDNIEYYCERINVNSELNINGINGLFFSNNRDDKTRFEGVQIDTEDPRLFICNDKIYVIFNAISPFTGYARSMAISEYDHFNPIHLRIGNDNEREHIIEKNWSPCVVNNKLYLIYLFDPLIVLHYDFNSEGICWIEYKQKPEIAIASINTKDICLRGSSSFIPLFNGFLGELYIGLCHSYICKNDQYYYFAYLCILNVTEWKIVYISKPIACKSLLTDTITKYKDTDIICNYNRYYYKHTYLGTTHSIDINVIYPTSIYKSNEKDGKEEYLNEFVIILNLNKYSLKNKMIINFAAILQKIIETDSYTELQSWDEIVKNSSMELILSI
jgi:hypothetical protein